MPKLPLLSGKEVCKILFKFGFVFIRQKGSHAILKKEGNPTLLVVVPMHPEIKRGTLSSILRQAHLSREEFEKSSS